MPLPRITAEVYVVPYRDDLSILYAPLVGAAAVVNRPLLSFLADPARFDCGELPDGAARILHYLERKGVVAGPELDLPQDTPSPGDLRPSRLTLFLTRNCTLRCGYCYAACPSGTARTMSWDTAVRAVTYYLRLCLEQDRRIFALAFHGGGEPFWSWRLMRRITDLAEKMCRDNGLELRIAACTNGMLTPAQTDWAAAHVHSLSISFDGLPWVQNQTRPRVDGGPSFPQVDRVMRRLDALGFPYTIRCAASALNVDRFEEIIRFIATRYHCQSIVVEPVTAWPGAPEDVESQVPNRQLLIAALHQSISAGRQFGLRVRFSSVRVDRLRTRFCYLGSDDFAVTTDGDLTACWEVTGRDHPLAETFIVGRLGTDGHLHIDRERFDKLRGYSVRQVPYCQHCYAKWHCAGNCVTKAARGSLEGPRDESWCLVHREIVRLELADVLEGRSAGACLPVPMP